MTTLLPHYPVQLFCKVRYVVAVQSRHRNPSVSGQINVRLFDERLALFRLDPSEAVIV
jgi:hypothetical protein